MGLTNYILTCEKDNEELRYELNYYKNYSKRLKEKNAKYKKVIDKLNKLEDIRLLTMYFEDGGEMSVLPYEDILDILKEVE